MSHDNSTGLVTEVRSFGDARQLILQTIIQIRDGGLDVSQGMAIAANMKVLNDNLRAEIDAAKLSMVAKERGYEFGNVVRMGQRLIGNSQEQIIESGS